MVKLKISNLRFYGTEPTKNEESLLRICCVTFVSSYLLHSSTKYIVIITLFVVQAWNLKIMVKTIFEIINILILYIINKHNMMNEVKLKYM